jgi:hypothetical protein
MQHDYREQEDIMTIRLTPNKATVHRITISPEEAVAIYGVNKGTLANLRSRKLGCPYYKVNRKILYKVDEFERWLFSIPVKTMESADVR